MDKGLAMCDKCDYFISVEEAYNHGKADGFHAGVFAETKESLARMKEFEEEIRADERINTVQFIIDEFNRRTVYLGRATAKTYVINTLNEILEKLKEQNNVSNS